MGQTSRIEGFAADAGTDCGNKSVAFVGYHADLHEERISYAVRWDEGGGVVEDVLTSQRSGYSYITPDQPGVFHASLTATDSNGDTVTLASWELLVVQDTPFGLRNESGCNATEWGAELDAKSFLSSFRNHL